MDLLATLCKMFLLYLKMPVWELFQNNCCTSDSAFIQNNFKCLRYGLFCDVGRGKGSAFCMFLPNAPLHKIFCLSKAQLAPWRSQFSLLLPQKCLSLNGFEYYKVWPERTVVQSYCCLKNFTGVRGSSPRVQVVFHLVLSSVSVCVCLQYCSSAIL